MNVLKHLADPGVIVYLIFAAAIMWFAIFKMK